MDRLLDRSVRTLAQVLADLVVGDLSVVAGIVLAPSVALSLHLHDLVHHLHLHLLHAVQRCAINLASCRRKSVALGRVCTRIIIDSGAVLGTA